MTDQTKKEDVSGWVAMLIMICFVSIVSGLAVGYQWGYAEGQRDILSGAEVFND